ncbi:MAG: type II secretion system protein [Campylobacter sp.]|uniref:type II secretion system protein n=1 Tax=Campylobacter sp. TaxID=205 RepID=UPI002A801BC4|nr:type II secretion system protein [Campylobacter sp.]MDY5114709.1 type II secretion system protein [Campylobacter sp.]
MFVIVILGILASVAIPRLAATREDAEISAAVANLRTLVSDATAYYTAKGSFSAGANGSTSTIKWNEVTNVPLKNATNTNITSDGVLIVGGQDCIKVALRDRPTTGTNTNQPAHIVFSREGAPNGVCKQVVNAEPLKPYFTSKVNNQPNSNDKGAMAIGSSTSVYQSTTN